MPTFRQDEKLGTKVPLIKTADINDKSITKEKLAEGSVTNSKLAPESVTQDKFDKELLQIFKAAAGLPENLIETIQNVDTTLTDHQRQISSNDDDISDLQTKTKQIKDTVDGIAVSGGASVGSAVTYDNTQSGLDAQNIQNAIDELVNNLGHYETNEEWLRVYTDAEGKFLWGIRIDGSIDWSVGIPKPIQKALNEIIANNETFQQTLTDAIEAYKATIDEKVADIDEKKVDKEEGKSLIEDEVKECFKVIENEEFIKAVVDSDDKVLFGFRRDTGKPYYPLNEMYHVEQNEEFFALWLDAADHILLGIRRDGEIIGEIHAVNALKKVISQLQSDVAALQEKVGTIDTNLKELLDVFSLQDNEEFLAVERDAEGKVLSSTNPDGSHYIHNAKSETIPTEFEHIEDPEGRMEITTDAENKILGYRDSEGTRHEHKISASHIDLSDEAAKEVNDAFKSAGIKMENPSDFSKDTYVELPIPRIAAQVRIYAPKLPTTKQDDIEAEIEYNDKDGNYFRKPVILNSQGSSSMSYIDKKTGERGNMAIDINDNSKIKFGDFPTQDSFHLKKYYIDAFRGQCIVGYWLTEQVYKSRPAGKQYPYESSIQNNSSFNGLGSVNKDFFTGAKCHPDGFPIVVTWIDNQGIEKNIGVYTWNLKKSKEVYFADKKKAENIILDGVINNNTIWGGKISWSSFEIRNPKSLKDINGNKYDGDNPKELSDSDSLSKKVKDYLIRWSNCWAEIKSNKTKETYEKYFLVDFFIDYYIISQVIYNIDGFTKNWIWCTWDGLHWTPTLYDLDAAFGSHWNGTLVIPESDTKGIIGWVLDFEKIYAEEISARYKELRNLGIFSTENIMGLFDKWLNMIGYENLKADLELYNQTPSYRDSNINDEYWELVGLELSGQEEQYNNTKEYSVGDICYIDGNNPAYVFKCVKSCTGQAPFLAVYDTLPTYCGYYNSPHRVANWLKNRIEFLDNNYSYTK